VPIYVLPSPVDLHDIAAVAPLDLDTGRDEIEAGLEHGFLSITIRSFGGSAPAAKVRAFQLFRPVAILGHLARWKVANALHEVRDRKHNR
jgi:hypothetical protein